MLPTTTPRPAPSAAPSAMFPKMTPSVVPTPAPTAIPRATLVPRFMTPPASLPHQEAAHDHWLTVTSVARLARLHNGDTNDEVSRFLRAVAGRHMNPHLPELVLRYLDRSLPPDESFPALVRVRQTGEMWQKPEARLTRFEAIEDFAVDRVAFSWRARFPLIGRLALTVVDEFRDGGGRMRLSLGGIPLRTQTGHDLAVGEAMRYLAELVWAPEAIASNRQVDWRRLDEATVEVTAPVGATSAVVRWEFDASGDMVRATGTRPFPIGKTFVPRPWGGDFGDFERFAGTRIPTVGEAWWDLPEGRFIYWRGRITAVERIASETY